ncbi:MAG: hypothetical protein CMF70_07795 [Magnetovibrio sp.]|nr:hypothetical protein [Magnetovibrio sp.]
MMKINLKVAFNAAAIVFLSVFALSACVTSENLMSPLSVKTKKEHIALRQFKDIPIPNTAEINVDKTLVFGTDDWIGQLAVTADQDPFTLYNFFRKNLPNHQWEQITAIRAPTSVLAYKRENRVLTMQISSTTEVYPFSGSDILMTMSPKDHSSTLPNSDG